MTRQMSQFRSFRGKIMDNKMNMMDKEFDALYIGKDNILTSAYIDLGKDMTIVTGDFSIHELNVKVKK